MSFGGRLDRQVLGNRLGWDLCQFSPVVVEGREDHGEAQRGADWADHPQVGGEGDRGDQEMSGVALLHYQREALTSTLLDD